MIDIHSKTSKQKCYIIVTYIIRQTMSTSKTQCLTPFFKVYKGMKIIIIENLYPKFRIVNGSIGYIKNMSLANSEWI
jgi:ATP-dependent exoDNAse (exonuclease V) alpha subunit